MNISPFFHNLYSAYSAELDDLRTDSDGQNVLGKRLADKRQQLGFLLNMLESSPEMVAVVLHQAFRFHSPKTMDYLIAQDAEDLPPWESIQTAIEIAPWAASMVQTILQEPQGAWFMTLATALEYLHNHPAGKAASAPSEDEDADAPPNQDQDHDQLREQRHDDSRTEDHDTEEAEARAHEKAGNDWLAEQGFDRKE